MRKNTILGNPVLIESIWPITPNTKARDTITSKEIPTLFYGSEDSKKNP